MFDNLAFFTSKLSLLMTILPFNWCKQLQILWQYDVTASFDFNNHLTPPLPSPTRHHVDSSALQFSSTSVKKKHSQTFQTTSTVLSQKDNWLWVTLPVSLLVVIQEFWHNFFHLDKPAGNSPVYQRCVWPPAERVAMFDGAVVHQATFLFEVFQNVLVCILSINGTQIWVTVRWWTNEESSDCIINRVCCFTHFGVMGAVGSEWYTRLRWSMLLKLILKIKNIIYTKMLQITSI